MISWSCIREIVGCVELRAVPQLIQIPMEPVRARLCNVVDQVRMSHGGQSVPLGTIPESYEESMKSLPEARTHADDLLFYDNTPNGRGHRLVARFICPRVSQNHTHFSWRAEKMFRPRTAHSQL